MLQKQKQKKVSFWKYIKDIKLTFDFKQRFYFVYFQNSKSLRYLMWNIVENLFGRPISKTVIQNVQVSCQTLGNGPANIQHNLKCH